MIIEKITDKEDERLDLFYMSKESSLKKLLGYDQGVFVVESELVINRALNQGYVPELFLITENTVSLYSDIFARCNKDILVYEVTEEIFKSLKGYILLKGILGIFRRKEDLSIEDVLNNSKRIVVLEDIVNPTNIGAIFRNAAALFVDGILVTSDSCDPLYRRSIRVSMGNVFNIRYTHVDKDKYIDILHNRGFKIVSFALKQSSVEIDNETLNSEDRLAIVFGSEGSGLSESTINSSDYVVKISMNENVDSLNVASASGIALWQLCKNNKGKQVFTR